MTITDDELKEIFDDFLEYWDNVTEIQDVVNKVDMKKSRYFLEQVIPKFIEKERKKEIIK